MNENSTKRPHRKFAENFKREALNHWLTSGKSAETIAQELGINANLLYAWRQRFAPADPPPTAEPATLAQAQAQLKAAQREIRHLREQRDILKKTLGIISQPLPSGINESTP
jgi:transposase-like protein